MRRGSNRRAQCTPRAQGRPARGPSWSTGVLLVAVPGPAIRRRAFLRRSAHACAATFGRLPMATRFRRYRRHLQCAHFPTTRRRNIRRRLVCFRRSPDRNVGVGGASPIAGNSGSRSLSRRCREVTERLAGVSRDASSMQETGITCGSPIPYTSGSTSQSWTVTTKSANVFSRSASGSRTVALATS